MLVSVLLSILRNIGVHTALPANYRTLCALGTDKVCRTLAAWGTTLAFQAREWAQGWSFSLNKYKFHQPFSSHKLFLAKIASLTVCVWTCFLILQILQYCRVILYWLSEVLYLWTSLFQLLSNILYVWTLVAVPFSFSPNEQLKLL